MIVYNLKNNIYLMRPDDPYEPEFACKLFVSKLSINELQNFDIYVNRYNINNFNNMYFQKILNFKLDFEMKIVFDTFDNIKYPIILAIFPLNNTLNDYENYNLWIDTIDSLTINSQKIKQIKKQNIEIVFSYLSKYFNEEFLFFK